MPGYRPRAPEYPGPKHPPPMRELGVDAQEAAEGLRRMVAPLSPVPEPRPLRVTDPAAGYRSPAMVRPARPQRTSESSLARLRRRLRRRLVRWWGNLLRPERWACCKWCGTRHRTKFMTDESLGARQHERVWRCNACEDRGGRFMLW